MQLSQEYIFKKFGDRISKLSSRIQDYVEKGGSIYDPKRQRPYYDYLDYLHHEIEKFDETFTKVDLHRLCGFDFDTNYNDYVICRRMLREIADENNCVDAIKKTKGKDSPKTFLQKVASQIPGTPDQALRYLYDGKYTITKPQFIKLNSAEEYFNYMLIEVRDAYPEWADATGMKRDYPHIYNMIRNFMESRGGESLDPPIYTKEDLYSRLKLIYASKETSLSEHELKKKILIDRIKSYYPDGNIDNIIKEHYNDYIQLNRLAKKEGVSLTQIALENGLIYSKGQKVKQLGRVQVHSDNTTREMDEIHASLLAQYGDISQLPDIEQYRIKLQVARKAIKIINSKLSTQ